MTTRTANHEKPLETQPPAAVRQVAVIDVGTASIRMAIAEITSAGRVRTLETLSQAVSLGKDTFTKGLIERDTIEDCVRVLKSYRRKLGEFQIANPDQLRVVATSAVREATNQLAFLDRVYIATGIEIQPLEEAEVNRITYLGIQPFLAAEPSLATANTIVIEVGGGSTELLVVKGGDVAYSHTFRLGSLRLHETLSAYRTPTVKVRDIMESQIERTVEHIREHVPQNEPTEMIALGGDVRFAVSQLDPEWSPRVLARVPVSALEQFTNRVLRLSEDEVVRKYHLSFPDAETLGPALLTYVQLARAMKLQNVLVTNTNLRDGLLQEMASGAAWTDEFNQQIIRSALDLGRKYGFDEEHGRHVAELSKTLFAELREEHQLDSRYGIILYTAALLHEVGLFVSNRAYHKHAQYLIQYSDLFGLTAKDQLLVALVARYHRRASPKPTHEGYATLPRDQRVAVAKLAALLRIAIALDESRSQRIHRLRSERGAAQIVIATPDVEDLSLEQLALRQNGEIFEEVFGMQVLLRTVRDS